MEAKANEIVKHASETVASQESLVARASDARKALELIVTTCRQDYQQWTSISKDMLNDLRQWRMAIDNEATRALSQFGDVRKFFLSADHAIEIERLRDFVDLCERLQKLKQTGFLDHVADTILKLDSKP